MQEAYRPQEGARCWPPPLTDPPPRLDLTPPVSLLTWPPPPVGSLTWPPPAAGPDPPQQLDLTPPSAAGPDPPGSWTWPPLAGLTPSPPGSWTWPPLAGLTPPQVWTKWKHYLPHPSDAGGKYSRRSEIEIRTQARKCNSPWIFRKCAGFKPHITELNKKPFVWRTIKVSIKLSYSTSSCPSPPPPPLRWRCCLIAMSLLHTFSIQICYQYLKWI